MNLPKKAIFTALLTSSIYFLGSATPVAAQVSLVVSPPRYDETIDPGQTIQKTIKVTNDSDKPITLKVKVFDFIVEDGSGTPIQVTEKASGRYLSSPWFTLDRQELTISPHATELVYALIAAPQDALPGGHYAGVYFSPSQVSAPAGTSGAGVVPQIGSLFSLTVKGDIKYDALIRDFSSKQNVYEYGPVEFQAVIENQSDTHIKPQTSITIKDLFGRTLETIALDEVNIFPFKSRTLNSTWQQVWGLGRFTATLSAAYGPGLLAERTIFFWILPWRLLAAIVVVLMVLLVVYISLRRHLQHRRDNRDTEIDELKRKIVELENKNR